MSRFPKKLKLILTNVESRRSPNESNFYQLWKTNETIVHLVDIGHESTIQDVVDKIHNRSGFLEDNEEVVKVFDNYNYYIYILDFRRKRKRFMAL
jgi:hypothetical protein